MPTPHKARKKDARTNVCLLRVSKLDQDLEKNKLAILKLISQRTTEALQARKQQGMPLGLPKGVGKSKWDTYQVEITTLLNNGATKTWIARKYGTSRRNLSHWMKQHTVALEVRLSDDQSCSETMPGKDELS